MDHELFNRIRADWRALPAWGDFAEVIDTTERYATLDMIQRGAQFGTKCWSGASIWKLEGYPEDPVAQRLLNSLVDWDSIMVSANSWHDRLVNVARESDPARRDVGFENLRADVQQLCDVPWHSIPNTANVGNRLIWSLIAGTDNGTRNDFISRTTFDSLLETMFVVEEYRYLHGTLPHALQVLTPEGLPAVPQDPYAWGDVIHYSLQGTDGYVLYSVGPCGGDNGGLTEYSDISFRVRMPWPEWLEPVDAGRAQEVADVAAIGM
jgi:hypothetical protein